MSLYLSRDDAVIILIGTYVTLGCCVICEYYESIASIELGRYGLCQLG